MTINDKLNLLLRMQIHCMNPNGSGESTTQLLQEATTALQETTNPPDATLNIVEDILKDIGMPHRLVGYRYAVEAILLANNNPNVLRAITKELYPTVAEKCGTTPSKVERGIRHAIEVCFDRADYKSLTKYFGQTVNPKTGRPMVSEFVSIIADEVKMVERKNQKGE